jgi:hypothetical protein
MLDADPTAFGLINMDFDNVSQFPAGDEASPFASCIQDL